MILRPINFGIISGESRIYRSAYPTKETLPFVDSLGLKTMICLNPDDLKQDLVEYAKDKGIKLLRLDVGQNIEPFVTMNMKNAQKAVETVCDSENAPCLVFCNKGTLRTCCVVGCLRQTQGWSLVSTMAEFDQFSNREGGAMDAQFIEHFAKGQHST